MNQVEASLSKSVKGSYRALPWQSSQWSHQLDVLEQDRIPHAFLVVGESGIGKRQFALAWAQRLLCQEGGGKSGERLDCACGECKSCQLFLANNHVDFLCIEPQESSAQIKVDQIRTLNDFIYAKPQIASKRIVLIAAADRLNVAAGNALLKCLEEPAEDTYLILLSQKLSYLMPTIRSRCHRMDMALPDNQEAGTWLSKQALLQDHTDEECFRALSIAQGLPLRALNFIKEGLLERHDAMRQDFLNLALSATGSSVVALAEAWSSQPLEQLLEWMTTWTHRLLKGLVTVSYGLRSSSVKSLKDASAEQLDILLQYVELPAERDSLLHFLNKVEEWSRHNGSIGVTGEVVVSHSSEADQFQQECYDLSCRIDLFYKELIDLIAQVNAGANLNQQMLLESLLMQWQKILTSK